MNGMSRRLSRPAGEVHPTDRLPEFAAGTLGPAEQLEVNRHVTACERCTLDVAAWRSVSEAAQAEVAAETAPPSLAAAVAERIAREARPREARPREAARGGARRAPLGDQFAWLGRFVAAQVPLVRHEIWPASTVIMAIGAAISLLGAQGSAPGAALSLFAPLAAAVGIALIYGQENDPSLELALATPTSPRLVIVARLVVVVAWDLALALAASVALAVVDGPAAFWPLVSLWLGPMLVIGCLTLLLSLFTGSSLAIAIAGVIWALRAFELTGEAPMQRVAGLTAVLDAIWQTSPLTLAAAALFLLIALAVAPLRDGLTPNATY